MNKVGIGIVGSKFAAGFHADSYLRYDKTELIAVAAVHGAEEFKQQWPVKEVYEDYRKMLERDDIQLISVCAPNFRHHEVVLAAARAKKNVVCEKPMATTSADAEEMVRVCEQEGVHLFYAEDWLFAPALIRALEVIGEHGIGDLLYLKARETHNGSHSPYAKKKSTCGGGSLIHLGIHPLAFAVYVLGGPDNPVVEVTGKTTKGLEHNFVHKEFEGEDWGVGILRFADGRFAFIEGNYITVGGMDDVVDFYGKDGRITVNLTFGSCLDVYSRKGYKYAIEKADFTYGWTKPAVDEFLNLGYVTELRYFVDCVLKDQPPKYGVDGKMGLTCMKLIEALYQSASEDRTIKGQW